MTLATFYANPTLSDGFGSTAGGRLNPHRGLDIPHPLGTPVPALAAGVVTLSTWHAGLGNIIEIRHDDGRHTGYRHLRTAAPRAAVGRRVTAGETIAQVSDTGSLADGYHLCTTNASRPGGVYGDPDLVTDPWPWIKFYALGGPHPDAPSSPAGGAVGPVIITTTTPTQEDDDDMDIFYIGASAAGTKYAYSRAKGRVVREIPQAEWEFLRAVEKTAGGIPVPLVMISAGWLAKALKLGR